MSTDTLVNLKNEETCYAQFEFTHNFMGVVVVQGIIWS